VKNLRDFSSWLRSRLRTTTRLVAAIAVSLCLSGMSLAATLAEHSTSVISNNAGCKLELTAWTNKSRYKRGEPIKVGLRLTNIGRQEISLDHVMILGAHVRVMVTSATGALVRYPGYNETSVVGTARDLQHYVRLLHGYFFGRDNITEDWIRISRRGKYKVYVWYQSFDRDRAVELGANDFVLVDIRPGPIQVTLK
jgi:hypothetical protein